MIFMNPDKFKNDSDHDLLVGIRIDVTHMKEEMKTHVRREEFEPVKKIVYGAVGIILIGALSAVLTFAIV